MLSVFIALISFLLPLSVQAQTTCMTNQGFTTCTGDYNGMVMQRGGLTTMSPSLNSPMAVPPPTIVTPPPMAPLAPMQTPSSQQPFQNQHSLQPLTSEDLFQNQWDQRR